MIKSKSNRLIFPFLALLIIFLTGSCASMKGQTELKIVSIVDRNGMTETINNSERIKQYQSVNFQNPQPYQKVLLIHTRNESGDVPAYLFSYHENSQPKQYLELINSRAHGMYREWHPNGNIKLQAFVIGGEADLTELAASTWLFDGHAFAWNEQGNLVADIPYRKGMLEGDSIYYHENGNVWRRVPFKDNHIQGTAETYLDNGELFMKTEYADGQLHGCSFRYWSTGQVAAEEVFQYDSLVSGNYYDRKGEGISQIREGKGFRALFGKEELAELHQFHNGIQEGEIKIFGTDNRPIRKFQVKNGKKHGEEIEYYELPTIRHLPKLSLAWYEGKIQGPVKTWYDNGIQESNREYSNNTKNGISTAWYKDGNLMLIEEYEQNKLMKGEYFRRGEKKLISSVKDGKGIVTLFDPDGNFVRKVLYDNGAPTGNN